MEEEGGTLDGGTFQSRNSSVLLLYVNMRHRSVHGAEIKILESRTLQSGTKGNVQQRKNNGCCMFTRSCLWC